MCCYIKAKQVKFVNKSILKYPKKGKSQIGIVLITEVFLRMFNVTYFSGKIHIEGLNYKEIHTSHYNNEH